MSEKLLRPLAIFLPQFHPIPENDEWWGKGFTEWTNVVRATPRFEGHYQPHLPTDLGYYDLRLSEVRDEQALMARQHGIAGFCYYHYWFNGRRVLERPIDEILESNTPDFPFCLCWANENWTRRWDGLDHEVLLQQHYSVEDDLNHIRFLQKFFRDPRYIRVDGKPVFIVYRPSLFPDIALTLSHWREECRKNGVGEIYLMYMQSFGNYFEPSSKGFDAAVEFQPDFWGDAPTVKVEPKKSYLNRFRPFNSRNRGSKPADTIFKYDDLINRILAREPIPYKRFPCVFPGWDNSPRRENGAGIFVNATPKRYGDWLSETVRRFEPYSREENFIFINAWNEWAEGNHLEPCIKWGRAFLDETKRALTEIPLVQGNSADRRY